eukprot:COSAG06_NODE_5356_length_3529_cov_11.018076_5_plen_101_part_00
MGPSGAAVMPSRILRAISAAMPWPFGGCSLESFCNEDDEDDDDDDDDGGGGGDDDYRIMIMMMIGTRTMTHTHTHRQDKAARHTKRHISLKTRYRCVETY